MSRCLSLNEVACVLIAAIVAVLSMNKGTGVLTKIPNCPNKFIKPSNTCAAWLALRYSASIVDLETVVCCLERNMIVPTLSTTIAKADVDLIVSASAPKFASLKIFNDKQGLLYFLKVRPSLFICLRYFSIC